VPESVAFRLVIVIFSMTDFGLPLGKLPGLRMKPAEWTN
jgi:hypothetical protein